MKKNNNEESKQENQQENQQENKTVYIDDGTSFADMSAFRRGGFSKNNGREHASFKEMFETYINAVKLMFLPMLAVLGIIALAYLILYFLL